MKVGKHIELLDYLRGVAILAVLIFHTLGMAFGYDALPWRGWFRDFSGQSSFLYFLPAGLLAQAGVAVFFVVSGFCIHLSFETQGRQWRGFFVRRFFRIYPAYFLALVLSVVLLGINPGLDLASPEFWTQFLSHVFLVHNFSVTTNFGFNAALWSLAVEAQLYLLYPLLLGLARRIGWGRAVGLLALVEISIRFADGGLQALDATGNVGGQAAASLANSALGYWFSWAMGAFIAEAWLKKEPLPFACLRPWPWLACALGCHFIKPLNTFQFLLFALTTAVVTARGLSGTGLRLRMPSLSWALLQKIGLWSYSIYLLHQPLLHVYSHLIVWAVPAELRPAPVAFGFVMATWLIIIPFCACWYEWIEVPGIALGKRMIAGRTRYRNGSEKTGAVKLKPSRRGRGLMAFGLVAGLAASVFVSYQFSVRAAWRHSREAWTLATSPNAAERNGQRAVALAEGACLQTQYRQPAMIASLAAAYAEAGRFDEAMGAAQMAGKMADEAGDKLLVARCHAMLQAFGQRQPFRDTDPATNSK